MKYPATDLNANEWKIITFFPCLFKQNSISNPSLENRDLNLLLPSNVSASINCILPREILFPI